MEENINNGPRYTDPSEIQALSKYLRKEVKKHEDSVELDNSESVLPGERPDRGLDNSRSDLAVPQNINLDSGVEKLKVSKRPDPEITKETIKLRDTSGTPDPNNEVYRLRVPEIELRENDEIFKLEDQVKVKDLPQDVFSLDINKDEMISPNDEVMTLQKGEDLKELRKDVAPLRGEQGDLRLDTTVIPGPARSEIDDEYTSPLETLDLGKEEPEFTQGIETLRVPKKDISLNDQIVGLKEGLDFRELNDSVVPLDGEEKLLSLDTSTEELDPGKDKVTKLRGKSDRIERPENTNRRGEPSSLREKKDIFKRPENANKKPEPENLRTIGDRVKLSPDDRKSYQEIQRYLGLDNLEQAIAYQMTVEEYSKSGDWGKRAAALLTTILSKNAGLKSYIPREDVIKLVQHFKEAFPTATLDNEGRTGKNNYAPNIDLSERIHPDLPRESGKEREVRNDTLRRKYGIYTKTKEGDYADTRLKKAVYGLPEMEEKAEGNRNTALGKYGVHSEKEGSYGGDLGDRKPEKIPEYSPGALISDTSSVRGILNMTLNPVKYIRWAVEETVGKLPGIHGADKRELLNEALKLAILTRDNTLRLIKAHPGRLPGAALNKIWSGAISDVMSGQSLGRAAANAGMNIMNLFSEAKEVGAVNRPDDKGRNPASNDKTVWGWGRKVSFENEYLQGWGIDETIEGLGLGEKAKSGRYEDFRQSLIDNPYVMTNTNLSQLEGDKMLTLDSNHIWEIQFFPYVGKLNGGYSYLPSFTEMNFLNKQQFGHYTYWNEWLPFTGFEVQKAKLSNKSMGLFDGQIEYPTSIEFTNELRLTLVDDQYKTFKRYFEKVMEVSVFNSNPHNADFYRNGVGWLEQVVNKITDANRETQLDSILTRVQKTVQAPAPYKNITFRCIIYSMTPQYYTVKSLIFWLPSRIC